MKQGSFNFDRLEKERNLFKSLLTVKKSLAEFREKPQTKCKSNKIKNKKSPVAGLIQVTKKNKDISKVFVLNNSVHNGRQQKELSQNYQHLGIFQLRLKNYHNFFRWLISFFAIIEIYQKCINYNTTSLSAYYYFLDGNILP